MAKKKKSVIRQIKDSLQEFYHSFRKAILTTSFIAFTGCCLIFLPLIAAILVSGFVLIGSYGLYERKRRLQWEQALSFKMMDMHKQTDKIIENIDKKPVSTDQATHSSHTDTSNIGSILPTAERTKKFQDLIDKTVAYNNNSEENTAATEPTFMSEQSLRNIAKARAANINQQEKFEYKPVQSTPLNHNMPEDILRAPSHALNAGIRALPDEIFYSDSLIKEFVQKAVNAENLAILRQPIMSLPSRKSHFYMLSAQIEAYTNEFLEEKHYFGIARSFGLHHRIYDLLLAHAIEQVTRGSDTQFGISIESATLHNSRFMNRLLGFLKKTPDLAHKIVLDFRFTDFRAMEPGFIKIMKSLAALKCQFMISHIDSLHFDYQLMRDLNVKTLRMDAGYLLPMMDVAERFQDAIGLRRTLEAHGTRLVLQGIDDDNMLDEFQNFSPRFAYGQLFPASAALSHKIQETVIA